MELVEFVKTERDYILELFYDGLKNYFLSKKELSERTGISYKRILKLLKGDENMTTLEFIKINTVLKCFNV
jgi:hypothetical protein